MPPVNSKYSWVRPGRLWIESRTIWQFISKRYMSRHGRTFPPSAAVAESSNAAVGCSVTATWTTRRRSCARTTLTPGHANTFGVYWKRKGADWDDDEWPVKTLSTRVVLNVGSAFVS